MKQLATIIFIFLLLPKSWAQEPAYFNNIYQHNNNFAVGMTILETEGGYVGYGGTEDPNNIGQMLLLYKISLSGDELIWNSFGENYHSYYYGNVGGAMINTSDGNFALTCHYGYGVESFGTLVKLNEALDTLWQKHYHPAYKTVTVNCNQTSDSGYIITGWVWQSEEDFSDLLLLKTDSLGNYQWHQTYGIASSAEQGANVIETPDGGYLIGGYFWKPGYDHSLDAMVIKTDSLGNEEWTQYYGNPYVDDDLALVSVADDGNYLVATVYGEWVFSSSARAGQICFIKLDNEGNPIWEKKMGPKRLNMWLKNFRDIYGGYMISGFSYETDTATFQYYSGWMLKVNNNLDSVWYRDYIHEDENWENFFYDASPTSDNGYIAVGKARPDQGGATNKLWIIKVDSMGCDTAGCATGVFVEEISPSGGGRGEDLKVWPNPATEGKITFEFKNTEHISPPNPSRRNDGTGSRGGIKHSLVVFNVLGEKVFQEKVYQHQTESVLDVSNWQAGIYFAVIYSNDKVIGQTKFIVK